eukprot:24907-Ditylum_brightwellii.AAC.1
MMLLPGCLFAHSTSSSTALFHVDHLSSATATVVSFTAVAETNHLVSSPASVHASLALVVMWYFHSNTTTNVAMHYPYIS